MLAAALWSVLTPPASVVASVLIGGPAAASFLRDWLVVSGQIDPHSARYRRMRQFLGVSARWLPPLLRLLAVGPAVMVIGNIVRDPTHWSSWLARPGVVLPAALTWGLALLGVAALALTTLGALARVAAIGLSWVACVDIGTLGFHPYNGALLAISLGLLLLGSGALSLWQPEERLLRRRAGETAIPPSPGNGESASSEAGGASGTGHI